MTLSYSTDCERLSGGACTSGGAIAFLLFSTVSIRVLPTTPASPEAASSPGPAASAGAGAIPVAGSRGGMTGLGGSGNRQAIAPGPDAAPGGSNGTGPGGSTGSGSGGSGGGTTLSGGTDPAPAPPQGGGTGGGGSSSSSPPSQAPAAPSSSAPQPAPGATQAASSGLCVKVGPLGLCLKV